MIPFVAFYAVVSVIAYITYAIDKKAAIKNRRRVSEKSLHLLGVVGGWPGALLAQQQLRHKTQKTTFQVTFWLTVVVNLACAGWLMVSLSLI
ncbi:DUF1294 domain-containing protein [Halomonas sp. FeN2]|uniref:DUF1294 domain-containing protein n=1 Tax=Vreelandella neptunia TaxID=115551 RepID=A0ABZ0YQN1_9GAMM|nr:MULTISPECIES: DUF1294 domain-containing protein [Halomonas]TDV99392.1 uncharacterized membrane protein YsdA (DUF1294 family) [Halomonas alkaliantarctica]MBF57772.1 cold-shock protein [Halomonas sp.]MBL1268922.1 DUF1294 domain-containing protein [Halomonas sp.]MDN3561872.1 DUF1294 domain-containing protein [Halomonas neptunia]UBR49677.1 DUF1294 domain-containing protein [Halomonas sp. FeN2]